MKKKEKEEDEKNGVVKEEPKEEKKEEAAPVKPKAIKVPKKVVPAKPKISLTED